MVRTCVLVAYEEQNRATEGSRRRHPTAAPARRGGHLHPSRSRVVRTAGGRLRRVQPPGSRRASVGGAVRGASAAREGPGRRSPAGEWQPAARGSAEGRQRGRRTRPGVGGLAGHRRPPAGERATYRRRGGASGLAGPGGPPARYWTWRHRALGSEARRACLTGCVVGSFYEITASSGVCSGGRIRRVGVLCLMPRACYAAQCKTRYPSGRG